MSDDDDKMEYWVVHKTNAKLMLMVTFGVGMFLGACVAITLLALEGALK